MPKSCIVDSGTLVALLDPREEHHRWARETLLRQPEPWFACEAVVSEAFFLLHEPHDSALDKLLHQSHLRLVLNLADELLAGGARPSRSPPSASRRRNLSFNTIDRAANLAGAKRITHHDLRHLFVTRFIENGVDIPTFSHFLGHQNGDTLCIKPYGHLRDKHSANEAKKISF